MARQNMESENGLTWTIELTEYPTMDNVEMFDAEPVTAEIGTFTGTPEDVIRKAEEETWRPIGGVNTSLELVPKEERKESVEIYSPTVVRKVLNGESLKDALEWKRKWNEMFRREQTVSTGGSNYYVKSPPSREQGTPPRDEETGRFVPGED